MLLAFWFDYACPFSYLAATQVVPLAARYGARLVCEPICAERLAELTGVPSSRDPGLPAARRAYTPIDAERYARLLGVDPPRREPRAWGDEALRLTLLAGRSVALMSALFRATWCDGDGQTLGAAVGAAGLEAAPLLKALAAGDAVDALAAQAPRAAADAVFATPSLVVDGRQVFWGHDRFPFVERALRMARAS